MASSWVLEKPAYPGTRIDIDAKPTRAMPQAGNKIAPSARQTETAISIDATPIMSKYHFCIFTGTF
jgi:hypothetical protein